MSGLERQPFHNIQSRSVHPSYRMIFRLPIELIEERMHLPHLRLRFKDRQVEFFFILGRQPLTQIELIATPSDIRGFTPLCDDHLGAGM